MSKIKESDIKNTYKNKNKRKGAILHDLGLLETQKHRFKPYVRRVNGRTR